MDEFKCLEENYRRDVKPYLEARKILKNLKKLGKSNEEIAEIMKNYINPYTYIPQTLYHGSPFDFDKIQTNESTQKGKKVYAFSSIILAELIELVNK